jgi:hypothetical protein
MWPRLFEIGIALWMLISPVWIPQQGWPDFYRWAEIGCALGIIAVGLWSFRYKSGHAHLLVGLLAAIEIGLPYFGLQRPGPPGAQNAITSGLMLLLTFVIPNEASLPPIEWREVFRREAPRPQSK